MAEAARELGLKVEMERVTDPAAIAGMGVFSSPGLVVDGRVRATGRVLTVRQARKLLEGLGA